MRISPVLLARLLAYSFLFGVILALVNGTARAVIALIDGKSFRKNSRLERSLAELYASEWQKHGIATRNTKGKRSEKGLLRGLKNSYTFIIDLALFILAGAGIILLCYYLNYGEFRAFCVLGTALGFLLCRITFGELLTRAFGELMLAVRGLIFLLFEIIFVPLIIILKKCKKLLKKFGIKISNALEKKKKVLYNNNELLYIYTLSEKGFGFLNRNGIENNDSIMQQEQENGTDQKS